MAIEGGKFLDKKYSDLTGSREVSRAVERARQNPERDFAPHDRDERIEAYLDRLDDIVEDDRGFTLLKHKILKELTLDTTNEDVVEKVAQGLFQAEKRIAIEQGHGASIEQLNTEEVLAKYRKAVFEKQDVQERTLTSWLDYLQKNDAKHETWFRYFVVRNLAKMGTLNKEKGEYMKRTDYTMAPFPELNSEALGFVYRMLTTGVGSHEFVLDLQDTPEEQVETTKKLATLRSLIEKKDFAKLYVFAQTETSGALNRESFQGEWKKFDQGSDYHELEEVLKGKGTGWCTAEGSARGQLEAGDFHVYFTRGRGGVYSEPRIAIRMEGDTVAEVRGVNHRQELEPMLVETAQAKYHELPGGERFDKQSADMRQMTLLVEKQAGNTAFTKEDLRFLYELDGEIEGFGYDRDPRIAELRLNRDRQKDIPIICDCPPELIATDIYNLTKRTLIFCKDGGGKLSFVDFREPKNQEKLPQIIEFSRAFRETDSEATLDVAIDAGIVSLDLKPETVKALESYQTAKQAYEIADSTLTYIYSTLENISWQTPESTSFQVLILEHGRTTSEQRDKLVDDMDKAGYRTLTFSELVALGIERPDLNKRDEILYTYEKHMLDGRWLAPYLRWLGVKRYLSAGGVSSDWGARDRSLFVRK